jgi:hypothetical protein
MPARQDATLVASSASLLLSPPSPELGIPQTASAESGHAPAFNLQIAR